VKGNDSLLRRNLADADYSRLSLWIDLEGAAAKVLRGATEVFGRTENLLIGVKEIRSWTDQWLSPSVDVCLEQ
jgi:hypothetical protein